ncbi:hypothetical protein NVP1023O_40 [Vibrio phage 1.023.O._10N.222.51.B4]|nr:hypothetical protein NVP1023O_40 [Vibrio phage 1.023.O._10N.222.51.B4]
MGNGCECWVYHYYGSTGNVGIEGVARTNDPVLSSKELNKLKDDLAECYKVERDELILKSLSFLHKDDKPPFGR